MTHLEALELIKSNISNLEIKTTEANLQNVSQAMQILNALIEMEHKALREAEQAIAEE